MPSEKRARQRAAREQKQAVIQKSRKRRRNVRRSIGFAILAAIIIGIVFLVNRSAGKSAKSTTTTTTSVPASSTTSTFPTPTTQALTSVAVAPACPPASGSSKRVVWFTKAPPPCIAASSVWQATFKTSLGSIVVQMPAAASFAAVNNFVFLARYEYFNGTFFHRIVTNFVVQGGDPTGTGSGGLHGFPGYSYTGNTPPSSCATNAAQSLCYKTGDLALANSKGPSTDGSQFFFILPGGVSLNKDPVYTLLGKVTSGMSVLEVIGRYGSATEAGTPTAKVYLLSVTVKQLSG